MKTIFTLLALTFLASMPARGALITYSFTGSQGNEASYPPDSQPTGATASDMTRGAGLTPEDGAGTFNSSGWTTNTERDLADYYSFTITPDLNYSLDLTFLDLDERRSGTGIREWALYSSLDGFTSDMGNYFPPDDTNTRTNEGFILGSAFSDLTTPVEFRIYAYAAEGAAGTWRIDNVDVFGTTELIAPPGVPEGGATLGLLGIAILGLIGLQSAMARRPGVKV